MDSEWGDIGYDNAQNYPTGEPAGGWPTTESGGPTLASWSDWLQKTAAYGLQRKWDAEYLLPFTVNKQVPYSAGTPLTMPLGASLAGMPGWALAAGAVGVGALILWALKD